MKPTDFLSVLGFVVLFANAWFERAGRALPPNLKPEWITGAGLVLILLGLAFRIPDLARAAGARRMKYGSNTLVFVAVVVRGRGPVGEPLAHMPTNCSHVARARVPHQRSVFASNSSPAECNKRALL